MAFVREAMLRLVSNFTGDDAAVHSQNVSSLTRWAEAQKDFVPMRNQDALPAKGALDDHGAAIVVVLGKLYVRQTDGTYQLVGSQT